jgi:hypothetical protein
MLIVLNVHTCGRKLVDPEIQAAIDEIDFTRNHIDVPSREKRMTNEIADMNELGADLEAEPAVVIAFGVQVFQCFPNKSHP